MKQPERRTLSVALQTPNLPEEALALIREGSPKPKVEAPIIAPVQKAEEAKPVVLAAGPAKQAEAAAAAEEGAKKENGPEPAGPAKAAKPKANREKGAELVVPTAFVPVTFRLPAEIPQGLVRASAERKIKKVRPCTQQEIVAEALGDWLRKNGYSETGSE